MVHLLGMMFGERTVRGPTEEKVETSKSYPSKIALTDN